MKMKRNQSVWQFCLIFFLLLYAYCAREWAYDIDNMYGKTALQLTRHLIHIGLVLAWIVSVNRRILQETVRRYLLAVGVLLAFWLYIRTVKWMFFPGNSWQAQYCWYAYYIPLILIPLFGVFLIQYLGKKDTYRLSGKWKLLYLPALFLIGLVYTNALHQWVFYFPEGSYSDSLYRYGAGYYLIVAWCLGLSLYFVVMLLFKCRAPGKRWLQKLPLLVLLGAVLFSVLYCLKIVSMDLTAVDCAIIIFLLEACIRSGLIRSNSGYEELFRAALLETQIQDENGKVCYTSRRAENLDEESRELMKNPQNNGRIYENKRLNCASITNGKIFWWENVEEILEYTRELEKTNASLREENDLLDAETKLYEDQLRIDEQNRLYDRITGEVAEQLNLLDELLESDPDTEKQRIAKICVLSAYIKRRSNLCLLAESEERIFTKELEFCITESLESLRLCGVFCSFESHCSGKTGTKKLILLYDVIQQIFQQLLSEAGALMIWLQAKDDSLFLKIQLDCEIRTEFPALKRWEDEEGSFTVTSSEDTTWLTLCMEGETRG